MAHVQQEQPSSSPGSRRFRYADPKSLPSYPSLGLPSDASASAAATVGWSRRQSPRPPSVKPTPERTVRSSAAAAASFAADSKGSQKRNQAVRELATNTGTTASPHRNSFSQENWGSSAACLAFKSQSAQATQSTKMRPRLDSRSSLMAAQEATASRPRSMSSPLIKQRAGGVSDTSAGQKWSFVPELSPSAESGAIPATALDRSMYTSHPPVSIEVEEKRRASEIHSSAVALARQAYLQQQKLAEQQAHDDAYSDDMRSSTDLGQPEPVNLHEAAYKLAQERLEKLQEEFRKNRELQEQNTPDQIPAPLHRVANALRIRHRSSSDSDLQLRRHNRTSRATAILPPLQSKADEEQRRKDREAVLAAARKNVESQLRGIDESIYEETGKVPPCKLAEWAPRAEAIALAKVASEMPPPGKRDVGGGMYVAQDEIDAVAVRKVKPILREMDVRAEKEHERQRVLKEEQAEKQLEAKTKKVHQREIRDIYRKLKEGQKKKDKEREQVLEEEDRKWKSGDRVLRMEEVEAALVGPTAAPRAPSGTALGTAAVNASATAPVPAPDNRSITSTEIAEFRLIAMSGTQNGEAVPTHPEPSHALPPVQEPENASTPRSITPVEEDSPGHSKEPALSPGKVKNWIKARLSRQKGSPKALEESEKGFVGGYTAKLRTPGGSTHSLVPVSSMREVAVAGRDSLPLGEARESEAKTGDAAAGPQLTRISSASSGGSDERFVDARETQSPATLSPTDIPTRAVWTPPIGKSRSPGRGSRFKEIID
ncbi:hypothetical protein SAPIO_CDS9680 [Scedosporium apiospermum]|uniref:Uncharacterized protein n=1 Tax=Pseudallescheria apiosperma TaxID=563466 RepID=A0A084FXB2_PSEDA|nr:uncharacterized protein SAPIO_CDS9680 [Scedosporium apiospermum]KEZ39724.1 hypothetical protein SAPIO_CDS9680 [Scedosporium apiospermum]